MHLLAVCVLAVAAVSPTTDVKVCTCSPRDGAFGGIASLSRADGIAVLFPDEHEQADILLDPHLYLPEEQVIAFLEQGGRVVYTRPEQLYEFLPVLSSEEKPGGVSWVHDAVPALAAIDWMPHRGGLRIGCVAKPGSTVIATVGHGYPFICYGRWGKGAVCVVGGRYEYFFHDEYLALLIRHFAACNVDYALFPTCSEPGQGRLKVTVGVKPTPAKRCRLRIECLRLIHDAFAKKLLALDKPNRPQPIAQLERALRRGQRDATVEFDVSQWPRGEFLLVFTLLDKRGGFLTSWVTPYTLPARVDVELGIDRDVALQGENLVFSARGADGLPLGQGRSRVVGPDGRAVVAAAELRLDGVEATQAIHVGKWIPRRYLLEVDGAPEADGFVADKTLSFYVAPARYEPPYWLGQWDINLGPRRGKDRTGILAYRELGFTYASWCGWGDHGPPWLERHRKTFRDRLDWAAAAGMKVCFWGHNDKSSPPKELLADFGLEETPDMRVALEVKEDGSLHRGGGKCLSEPLIPDCLTKTYAQLAKDAFSHPAFAYFVIADEPGRFSRCLCDRCVAQYSHWMESRGHSPQDFGVATWREAMPLKTRPNKRFYTERLTRWFEVIAQSVRTVRPDTECTVNEGGGAFTFDRDRYPWWGFGPLQSLEADVYPWWEVTQDESIIRRTSYTASILRCAGRYEKPFNIIVNTQEVHCTDEKRVARPPLMVPEDLFEQYYTAYLEGARRVEGYAGMFFHRWSLGKAGCYKEYESLMDLPDREYIEWMRRPRSEMQQVVREVASVLEMVGPIIETTPFEADVAVVVPCVDYPWIGNFHEAFKETFGGAPLDYVGEELDLAARYPVLVLPSSVGEAGLPETSIGRLKDWVSAGGLLVCCQNLREELRDLVGGMSVGGDGSPLAGIGLDEHLGAAHIALVVGGRVLAPADGAEVVGQYQDGQPAVVRSARGDGVVYLLGFDIDEAPEAAAGILQRIFEAEGVALFATSDQPRLNLSVRKLGNTYYLLALYCRGRVTWSVERQTRHPATATATFRLGVQGDYRVKDLLAGKKLRAKQRKDGFYFTDTLPLARLKVYSILPRGAQELALALPERCTAGDTVPVEVDGDPPTRRYPRRSAPRLVRINVFDPSGRAVPRLSRWFLSDAAPALDTCENEQTGEWTLELVDPHLGAGKRRQLVIERE